MRTDFYRPRPNAMRERAMRRHRPDPDQNERFTPGSLVGHGAQLAHVQRFDLDAAACKESHFASTYYTKKDDGLGLRWFGATWVNPPFVGAGLWVVKAWEECRRAALEPLEQSVSAIVMLLPATRSEQSFWQESVEPFRDGRGSRFGFELTTHFIPGRVTFGAPKGCKLGPSPFPLVFLIWLPSGTVPARRHHGPEVVPHDAPRVSSPFRLGHRSDRSTP